MQVVSALDGRGGRCAIKRPSPVRPTTVGTSFENEPPPGHTEPGNLTLQRPSTSRIFEPI